MISVNVACEGPTDEAALKRVLADHSIHVDASYVMGGKANIDSRLPGMKNAAKASRWLVLRDLNGDAACAPELVSRLADKAPAMFRLQVAVRKLESWLLADGDGIAAMLGLLPRLVPTAPDSRSVPRKELVALARRSKKGRVHRDFLPSQPSARVGPAYTARLIEFAARDWNHGSARRSPSLHSLIEYIRILPQA
jgi:hypothetical protein